MATGIGSPLALGGLYPSVDGRYVAANGKPFTSVSNAESALNGFPSKLSESCVGLTVLVKESGWAEAKEYWVQPKGTTPETYGLVEKGAGTTDYNDLDNKPTIGDGTNTALPIVGDVKVTASTASSDTAGVTVTPGQNTGEIEMQFTLPKGDKGKDGADGQDGGDAYEVYKSTVPSGQEPMGKTEWLASLKGADGKDGDTGAPGHNPCVGRFTSYSELPTTGVQNGDYAYIDTVSNGEVTSTKVYHYTTQWEAETDGVEVTGTNTAFNSGQDISQTPIKDQNGDIDRTAQGVLSAEAGNVMKSSIVSLQKEVAKKAEYEHIAGKNLINPAEVQLNKYIQYNGSTGAFNPTAPSNLNGAACSGLIPVEAGETYYLTRGTGVSSLSAKFVFIKEDGEHITAPLDPATDTPMNAANAGGSKAFKAPADAKYALIGLAFSGWTDTETQIVGFQFEKGNTPTEYEPWTREDIIPFEHLPQELSDALNDIEALQEDVAELKGEDGNIFVYNSELDAKSYIESQFADAGRIRNSMVVKRTVEQPGGHSECFNFDKIELLANGTSTTLAITSDDITPINFNGYYGANHGLDKCQACTVQGHGKTFADVGSVYTNGTQNFVIFDIRDENTLIICGKPVSSVVYPKYYMSAPTAGEYTHVSGGTNTASFTVAAVKDAQGKPIIKLDETFVYVDGRRIYNSGSYPFGDKVVVYQNYKIANPASILSILQANAGTYTTHPNYPELEGVEYMAKLNVSYIFTDASHCFVAQTLTFLQAIGRGYFGFIQSAVIAGNNTKMYIPKALPYNSLDFRLNPNYNSSTITSTVELTNEYWENQELPPDRYIQSSDRVVFSAGFLFDYGVGGNERKNVLNKALQIPSSSRKMYIRGFDNKVGDVAAGDSYSAICYRVYKPTSELNQSGVLLSNVFEYDSKLYIYADFTTAGMYEVVIPSDYIGKTVTVFEKSDNVTLITPMSSNTIMIQVSAASPMYGYLVAQIK